MNGGENGTMAEPMEISLPGSPVHKNKVTSESCDLVDNFIQNVNITEDGNNTENANNSDNSDHIASESSQGPVENSTADHLSNENGNDSKDARQDPAENSTADHLCNENSNVSEDARQDPAKNSNADHLSNENSNESKDTSRGPADNICADHLSNENSNESQDTNQGPVENCNADPLSNENSNESIDASQDPVENCNADHLSNENSHESKDASRDPVENCNADHLSNENSNESKDASQGPVANSNADKPSECNAKTSKVPEQKKCDLELVNSHCTNSNESNLDPLSISHAKLETTDNKIIHEKSSEQRKQVAVPQKTYITAVDINDWDSDEIDSEEDSVDEEDYIISDTPHVEDTVSINSDSESENEEEITQGSKIKNKNSDIIILENDDRPESQNGQSHDSEIHEIPSDDNDDCILTNDDKLKTNTSDNKLQLRRSSRAIKRKRYDLENGDDESDVEEVEMVDPLSRKVRPIVINDTKSLVEMAAKRMRSNQHNKKEPTVVIINTNAGKGLSTPVKNSVSSMNSNIQNTQSLYQSIVARGTTVTPVSSKAKVPTQSPAQITQPSILPSLTDDMFVVEAPSFIVPYVYEKPSIKPFKEFVDQLGKELEEQRAKEEKERLESEREEKEKRDKEKRERGEVMENETEKLDTTEELDEKKKKTAEKKGRSRRKNDDDDASWDGETSAESEEETMSDDLASSKDDVIETALPKSSPVEDIFIQMTSTSGKSDSYFDCSLGKFFMNIGLNMVQEYVQTDLLKQQSRKLYREKKSGHSTKATEISIASLKKNLEFSKINNEPYVSPQIKCEFCSFKTESILAMSNHLETPHMKNNIYKCNYCAFEIRSPHDILFHMEAEHHVRGKLERAPAYHQCPNCPFEDNGKGKLARHLIACAKKFKPAINLSPPIEWEPPAKIPKIARPRTNVMSTYQNAFSRQLGNNMGRPPIAIGNLMAGASGGFKARGRSPMAAPPRASSVLGSPIVRGSVMLRPNAPAPLMLSNNYPVANNAKKSSHQPSISITPLPRQPQPVIPQTAQQSKNSFVICEICDGYIKDLEQLRNHMQWIHKVKIHPKMIYNRPPLNCQKCQFRFFTDQGLERHLLGSHGLVTSSMQEAANKGKDAGRCPVCGRVYQWKLLNHVARDHNLTLKPAHLSYKCTVCTATFGMYKQFENHVYSAHSVVAKRVMDKSKPTPPAKSGSDSHLKPLKINDEITIIPQPVKSATSAKEK